LRPEVARRFTACAGLVAAVLRATTILTVVADVPTLDPSAVRSHKQAIPIAAGTAFAFFGIVIVALLMRGSGEDHG
jgi:hypothetical protein